MRDGQGEEQGQGQRRGEKMVTAAASTATATAGVGVGGGGGRYYLLQAVHDVFDLSPSLATSDGSGGSDGSDGSGGVNKIVVIGQNLDRNALHAMFVSCLC